MKIIAFVCSHCSLSAAETAGVNRLSYPSNVRIIQLACSGHIDKILMVEALRNGADGVLVFGCPEGDCHYKTGNKLAKSRVDELKSLLPMVGLEAKRLNFVQVGASEGEKFARAINDMFADLESLGPNPLTKMK